MRRWIAAVGIFVLLQHGHGARADEPVAPAEIPSPSSTPQQAPTPPPSPTPPKDGASLDFDLFNDANAKKPEGAKLPSSAQLPGDKAHFEKLVHRRRRMLQLHQGFGFATLVLVAATCVLGQLNYIDEFGGGNYTQKYMTPHLVLASASAATFATTGLLALIAPTPYKKPLKADAALLHKVMMGIATAGMVAQFALGIASAKNGGELFQRDLALTHLVTGYVTFASMATGYLAFVF
jgi:hypothetical protein